MKAAKGLLEREGLSVVGVVTTGTEALAQARLLRPDVSLVDIDLAQGGFDLARRLDLDQDVRSHVILIPTHAEEDFADLIATSPALGFVSKSRLASDAIERILERRDAGQTAGLRRAQPRPPGRAHRSDGKRHHVAGSRHRAHPGWWRSDDGNIAAPATSC